MGCEKFNTYALALAAGIEDSSVTVEMIRAFVSVDKVVNFIVSVCRIITPNTRWIGGGGKGNMQWFGRET